MNSQFTVFHTTTHLMEINFILITYNNTEYNVIQNNMKQSVTAFYVPDIGRGKYFIVSCNPTIPEKRLQNKVFYQ